MSTRYFNQPPHTTICGPVAMLNALKYVGVRVTSRGAIFGKIKKLMDQRPWEGCEVKTIPITAKKLGFKSVITQLYPTVDDLSYALKHFPSCPIILIYRAKYSECHAALLIGQTNSSFIIVNHFDPGETVQHVRQFHRSSNLIILESHILSKYKGCKN